MPGAAKERYERLALQREPFLRRARDAAKLTIPSLLPPAGHTGFSALPQPWQSTGSRGVNNLASNLLLSLFPPSAPFFRLKVDERIREQAAGESAEAGLDFGGIEQELQTELVRAERAIMDEFETWSVRTTVFEALKHAAAFGNALFYWPEDAFPRVYALDSYVVSRDPSGNILELLTRELVAPETLPEAVRANLKEAGMGVVTDTADPKSHELFTWVRRRPGKEGVFEAHQELGEGVILKGTQSTWPERVLPWRPLRFNKVSGESYGRGHVEEHFGDLKSLDVLSQALIEAAEQATRVVWLVKPNATTKSRVIAEAPNGAVRAGNEEDVGTLKLDKAADMRVALELQQDLKMSLGFAFLLRQGIQRQAERVTAEEVRLMAQELEDALGGVYSVQATEFQLPLVEIARNRLERNGVLNPTNVVRASIVTGLEALGRGHEVLQLERWLQTMIALPGFAELLNVREVATRGANGLGVQLENLLLDPEVVAQRQQQAQLAALAEKAAGPVSGAVASGLTGGGGQP